VAQVAFGSKDVLTLRAFMEAESYPGPSLIVAYSPCIAHGVDLSHCIRQQDLAVNSGHVNLLRYDPRRADKGQNPLQLDSKKPTIPFKEFAETETRFSMLWRTHPQQAARLMAKAQNEIDERHHQLQQLSAMSYEKLAQEGEE